MLLVLLLAVAEPQSSYPDFRQVSHSEMDAALRNCGIQHFTITYDDSLRSDVIELRDVEVTDDQLRCAHNAKAVSAGAAADTAD